MEDIFKNALGFVRQTAKDSVKQFGGGIPVRAGNVNPQNKVSLRLPPSNDSTIMSKFRSGKISRDEADRLLNLTPTPRVPKVVSPKVVSPTPASKATSPANFISLIKPIMDMFGGGTNNGEMAIPIWGTPTGEPTPAKANLAQIDLYLQSLIPEGQNQTLEQYYPAYQDISTRSAQEEQKYNRPGFRTLALAQAFHESTLGRAQTEGKGLPYNYFGFRPPASAGFKGYPDAQTSWNSYVDHLLGKKGYLLPILKGKGPITQDEVDRFYDAYNPDKAYLDAILPFFEK